MLEVDPPDDPDEPDYVGYTPFEATERIEELDDLENRLELIYGKEKFQSFSHLYHEDISIDEWPLLKEANERADLLELIFGKRALKNISFLYEGDFYECNDEVYDGEEQIDECVHEVLAKVLKSRYDKTPL